MSEPTINTARITQPKFFDGMPKVIVTFEGSKENVDLFTYYPDEISFEPEEFLGLTKQQAYRLKFNKDLKYIQS